VPDWGGRDLKVGTVRGAVRQLGIDWSAFDNAGGGPNRWYGVKERKKIKIPKHRAGHEGDWITQFLLWKQSAMHGCLIFSGKAGGLFPARVQPAGPVGELHHRLPLAADADRQPRGNQGDGTG
jgi:hypothetical protein